MYLYPEVLSVTLTACLCVRASTWAMSADEVTNWTKDPLTQSCGGCAGMFIGNHTVSFAAIHLFCVCDFKAVSFIDAQSKSLPHPCTPSSLSLALDPI